MWREALLVVSLCFAAGSGFLLIASEAWDAAGGLYRSAVLFGLFVLAVLALPIYLNLRAHGAEPHWIREGGRFLVREAPLESAALLMVSCTALLIVSPEGPLGMGLGVVVLAGAAGAAAASLEHLWGYIPPPGEHARGEWERDAETRG